MESDFENNPSVKNILSFLFALQTILKKSPVEIKT